MKKFIFLLFTIVTLAGMLVISGCKKKETYMVTFNSNGGTGTMAAQTFTEGEAQALARNTFTYEGYTFTGWNTVQGGSGASYTDGQTITATADMTLYAQWTSNGTNPTPGPTPSNIVMVTFDANGGTGEMAAQIFTEGEAQALTRNVFTYDGYTFTGWNTVQGGSGASYTDGQTITATADMTLYAQWTSNGTNPTPGPTPSNTVITFDANGGTGEMAPQTFTIGTAQALTANAFTKENNWFTGWNTAIDGQGTAYTDSQEITATENMTLYAQWKLSTGENNGHIWVDLGLPSGMLWATCNVGATAPLGYGNYFAWGETATKETYGWSTYRYCNGDGNTLTKYCNNANYGNNGFIDALTTLEASDDAATANWGSGWRMPTKEEFEELKNNCTVTWSTQSGVNGCLFTGPNGNSIFLPAAGRRISSSLFDSGSGGHYWSSSLGTDRPDDAWYLSFGSGYYGVDTGVRCYGRSVRPVCVSQN